LATLAFILSAAIAQAQAPQLMNYQSVVRNSAGTPVANGTTVQLIFTIHQDSAGGPSVFTETHNTTANSLGMVNVQIGSVNSLGTVDWSNGAKYLQVQADVNNGGLVNMGSSQLISVPYALFAGNSQAGPQGPAGPTGLQGPRGANGITGLTGLQGLQGATGAIGVTGLQGLQGLTGAVGRSNRCGSSGSYWCHG